MKYISCKNNHNTKINGEYQLMTDSRINTSSNIIYHLDSSKNKISEIKDFLDAISSTNDTTLRKWLVDLLIICEFPMTIILDNYYVDKVYRDEYYRYYSRMHFQISRNCKKIIFISGLYVEKELFSSDVQVHRKIEKDLIGMVVIKPNSNIGRTIINPYKLNISPCYLRTTVFSFTVYGHVYEIPAFPISGQDSEVMTCAEVNVWSIMEYFGTRYKEYRTILPSELLEMVKDYSDERQLPSEGLTPEQESLIFIKNGLYSKIYYNLEDDPYNGRINPSKDALLEDILSLYIESGIPVLLNLRPQKTKNELLKDASNTGSINDNHCVTCIGHGYEEFGMSHINKWLDKADSYGYNDDIECYPSCRRYGAFIFMEDHSIPYQSSSIDDLVFRLNNKECHWEIDSMVVPLHKHMFVSAERAFSIVRGLFERTSDVVSSHLSPQGDNEKIIKVIYRLFLTSSRNYKEFRIDNTNHIPEKQFYEQCEFPKLVWVCEYYSPDSYCNQIAYGEFVIDATSSKLDGTPSTILIRHSSDVFIRAPLDYGDAIGELKKNLLDKEFKMYNEKNLKIVERTTSNEDN